MWIFWNFCSNNFCCYKYYHILFIMLFSWFVLLLKKTFFEDVTADWTAIDNKSIRQDSISNRWLSTHTVDTVYTYKHTFNYSLPNGVTPSAAQTCPAELGMGHSGRHNTWTQWRAGWGQTPSRCLWSWGWWRWGSSCPGPWSSSRQLSALLVSTCTGCSGKIVFFSQFTATPPSPSSL